MYKFNEEFVMVALIPLVLFLQLQAIGLENLQSNKWTMPSEACLLTAAFSKVLSFSYRRNEGEPKNFDDRREIQYAKETMLLIIFHNPVVPMRSPFICLLILFTLHLSAVEPLPEGTPASQTPAHDKELERLRRAYSNLHRPVHKEPTEKESGEDPLKKSQLRQMVQSFVVSYTTTYTFSKILEKDISHKKIALIAAIYAAGWQLPRFLNFIIDSVL